MIKYKLSELLSDKELCKKVITKKFYLKGGGMFQTLDFENYSMRHNHIKAFCNLYEIGGRELFEAILKEGKTCLTDNPNAAKVGVVAIDGADGYYLKSNVSAIAGFMSILNAAKFLLANEEYDIGEVYAEYEDAREEILNDVSEEDMEYMDKLDKIHSGELTADEAWESELTEFAEEKNETEAPRWLEICGEKGHYTLRDENGEPFSFEILNGFEYETVTEMYDIQTLIFDGDILGYKYQRIEGGRWGFISKGFLQFLAPRFEDIFLINTNDGICPASLEKNSLAVLDTRIHVCISRECYCGNLYSEHRLFEEGYISESNPNCFMNLDKNSYTPKPSAKIESGSSEKGPVILYKPSENSEIGKLKYVDETGSFVQDEVHLKDYMLSIKKLGMDTKKVPADELTIKACCNLLNCDNLGCCVKEHLTLDCYIVEKERYYAIARINCTNMNISLVTPYAFTNVGPVENCTGAFYIERFGKKGVVNLVGVYLVPCEYESVEYVFGDNNLPHRFIVKKMGMEGWISGNGKWVKHMHRVEE